MQQDTPQPIKPSARLLKELQEAQTAFHYHQDNRNPSFTKKGPGRKHQQGKKKS